MKNDSPIVSKYEKRNDLVKDKDENLLKGIGEYWTPFYRENPHRFALDYLGINIHPFQQFLVYEINRSEQSCVIATRGKLFLAPII